MTGLVAAFDELDAEWTTLLAIRARRSVASWTADFDEMRKQQLALLERGRWRRGPDEFLEIIGRSRAELVHSAMVGWLLDPLGHHGLGPRLLHRLLARTQWEPGELSDVIVELEVSRAYVLPGLAGECRVDVLVRSSQLTLVIENKIDAPESHRQCEAMFEAFEDEPGAVFVFLTPTGTRAESAGGLAAGKWQSVSYKTFAADLRTSLDEGDPHARARHVATDYLRTLGRLFP